MLIGDYTRMPVCACENKQKAECWRVSSTMRYIKKESVRRFEIGRDKKVLQPLCRVRNKEAGREKRKLLNPEYCLTLLSLFLCSVLKIFDDKKKVRIIERTKRKRLDVTLQLTLGLECLCFLKNHDEMNWHLDGKGWRRRQQ